MTPAFASRLMPTLRRVDAERAHRLAITALRLGLAGRDTSPPDPALAIDTLGLHFASPIGLAAGFDKDALALRHLRRLGFGFIEAGSVTPRPQPGNPGPRVFRLEADGAVINRYGLNSRGIGPFVARLAARRPGAPVGANVGINKDCTDPPRDFAAMVAAVSPHADYVVINVSSPNTPGLRDLQGERRLADILDAIRAYVPRRPPLLVKIAPDLAFGALEAIVQCCIERQVQGLVVSNTTITRPLTLRSPARMEAGGLSGAPLRDMSTALLLRTARLAKGRLVLIGCGGVATGADALAKIRAGASLVQLYTAFSLHGPALIPQIKRELASALAAQGFKRLTDAIGADLPGTAGVPPALAAGGTPAVPGGPT